MKFRDVRDTLAELGIEWEQGKGKGSHGAFVGLSLGSKTRRVFPIPHQHQREVGTDYLAGLRRCFELTPKNGVPKNTFR